jgi:hypothetical protein
MKSYDLIHQLINLVAEMETENQGNEVSLQDFTGFLLNKVGKTTASTGDSEVRFGANDSAALDIAYQLDNKQVVCFHEQVCQILPQKGNGWNTVANC